MTDLPPALRLLSEAPAQWRGEVALTYDQRLLRRKRLETVAGEGFLVDLPSVTNLDDHWGFELADGSAIRVLAAAEEVLVFEGDLPRLAWHIGNRHTPCQIGPDRLTIRVDPVIEAMLRQLGARITRTVAPFAPEGGAYGTGRTMGHDHGGHDHGALDHRAHDHGAHDHGAEFGWHRHGDGILHRHEKPPAPRPFGHAKAR